MGSDSHTLHILFFPFIAPGHMLPIVDMAKLFAARGVKCSIFTTPSNARSIQSSIDRTNESFHHSIELVIVPFPSVEGLPEGCENFSSLPTDDLAPKLLEAIDKLRQPFDHVLTEICPDCVVTDTFLPWTCDIAAKHGIPRISFLGTCYFALCASDCVSREKPNQNNEDESFIIPGFPHRIEMLKSKVPDFTKIQPKFAEILKQAEESESKSYGVLVNSFYELEPQYAEYYRNVVGRKAWHVGPVSLCNQDMVDKSGRGDEASLTHYSCLKWLETMSSGSVVYICFGSLSSFSTTQLHEIALGLQVSKHPFIWVLREGDFDWMPEGFEESVEGRGMIIKDWAPQILILNHQAVGGFVTHCGWNSSLEGVTAGLPMVTWPLFAEQFYNERLIVDVLKIGVAVGVKVYSLIPEERGLVEATMVERVVEELMGNQDEAEKRRGRARELGKLATRAIEKDGSSYVDMGNLIQELITNKQQQQQSLHS